MSWASHPTTEMPVEPRRGADRPRRARDSPDHDGPDHDGRRQDRRRRGPVRIAVLSVALVVLVGAGAAFASGLMAFPSPVEDSAPPNALASTDASPVITPSADPMVTAESTDTTVSSATVATATPAPTYPVSVADSPALEAAVIELTNAERVRAGCAPLTRDANLAAAARGYSVLMASTGLFSHTGPDGSGPAERMRAEGYDVNAGWAENIAKGQPTAAAVMAAWMGSPGHRGNILNCALKTVGVGAARSNGQLYWTQDFGAR